MGPRVASGVGLVARGARPRCDGDVLISVLMPYRDAAATIEEAAGCVFEQRGVDLELIAIDDGSSDDSQARIARLAARHRAVVMIASAAPGQPGVGVAGALTIGLGVARGDLIARMDADDRCAPERLRKQCAALAADPALALVATQAEGFPAAHVGPGMAHYLRWQNQLITPADHARELFIESPLCHPSVLMRRAALAAVGGYRDTGGPEDYDLWLRLDAAGYGLAKVPEVLFGWRHRPGRATFSDPRYARARFVAAKAPHLARRVRALGRPLTVWGAGPTGKRLARALEPFGVCAERFIDIDPDKIGRVARGAPIVGPDELQPGRETIVVAVGSRGARALIRPRLAAAGMREGRDFVCAA